ncbi:MAG: DUF1616 domain-containing protein, partial [Candidatus Aenigmarchaeota archaeon]|nr:DUF1616 domain-containing protein [Candidatus Aenigmarchaeota archaeon]
MIIIYQRQESKDQRQESQDISIKQNEIIGKVFIYLLAVTLLSYVIGIDSLYSVSRALLGLVFVLFIPGYIASYSFFEDGEVDALERVALSVALSISLVVLTVMFSNLYLGIPINLVSIVAEIAFICVFFGNVTAFKRSRKWMGLYDRFVSKLTFEGHPKRKKKLFMISGISLIALFLAVDIFYPYIFVEPVEEERVLFSPIAEPYNFSELYDGSMRVYRFYPQQGVSETVTNVAVSRPWVVSFDDKIAFLGYDIDAAVLGAG